MREIVTDFDSAYFKQIMSDRKYTIEKVAKLCGYSAPAVSAWRSGANKPTKKAFQAICEGLGVAPSVLLTGDTNVPVADFSRQALIDATVKQHLGIDGLVEKSGLPRDRVLGFVRMRGEQFVPTKAELDLLSLALKIPSDFLLKPNRREVATPAPEVSAQKVLAEGQVYNIKMDNGDILQLLILKQINENCISGIYLDSTRRHSNWIQIYTDRIMYVNPGRMGVVLISRLKELVGQVSKEVLKAVREQLRDFVGIEKSEPVVIEKEVPAEKPSRWDFSQNVSEITLRFNSIKSPKELLYAIMDDPSPFFEDGEHTAKVTIKIERE